SWIPFHTTKLVVMGFLVVLAYGCGDGIQREYRWTRQEPAIFRRSPTTFAVRIRVDRQSNTVVWFEDAHDKEGDIGQSSQTWKNCEFLDDNNWRCASGAGIEDQIEMRDGTLIQQYWGERHYF